MLAGPPRWGYHIVWTVTFILSSFGLVLGGYLLIVVHLAGVGGLTTPVSLAVLGTLAVEAVFYLAWYLPFQAHLNRPGIFETPTTSTSDGKQAQLGQAQRRALFAKILRVIPDVERFIRKWHNSAHFDDIGKNSVKAWILWILFDRERELPEPDEAELDEYVALLEERLEKPFRCNEGDAKPLRPSYDQLCTKHRSLLFYLIAGTVDLLATVILVVQGFVFYRPPRLNFFSTFPLRPAYVVTPNESASPLVSYFVRPHGSEMHRPILFVPGMGFGLAQYLPFFLSLPRDVGIIAVELHFIASRITLSTPSTVEIVAALANILEQQGFDDVVLVATGLGTMFTAPALRDLHLAGKISSIVLIDPVSLLWHFPDAALNLTRLEAHTGSGLLMKFAALDPIVAYTLCRRLIWREHILFIEELQGRRATVVVADRDSVIDSRAVASYVHSGNPSYNLNDIYDWHSASERWTGTDTGAPELMYFPELARGQWMWRKDVMKAAVKVVENYCRLNQEGQQRVMSTVVEEEGIGGSSRVSSGRAMDRTPGGRQGAAIGTLLNDALSGGNTSCAMATPSQARLLPEHTATRGAQQQQSTSNSSAQRSSSTTGQLIGFSSPRDLLNQLDKNDTPSSSTGWWYTTPTRRGVQPPSTTIVTSKADGLPRISTILSRMTLSSTSSSSTSVISSNSDSGQGSMPIVYTPSRIGARITTQDDTDLFAANSNVSSLIDPYFMPSRQPAGAQAPSTEAKGKNMSRDVIVRPVTTRRSVRVVLQRQRSTSSMVNNRLVRSERGSISSQPA